MQTASQLKLNQTNSNAAVEKAAKLLAALNGAVEKIRGDNSRTPSFKEAEIKKAREAAQPAIIAEVKNVQSLAGVAATDEKFWESKPLVLSLQHFDEDPAKDAAIRTATAAELKLVPLPLLALTFENAKAEKNLPLIYQCYLAGIARHDEAGFANSYNLALDEIELPNQAVALAAISVCKTNRSVAESIWSDACSSSPRPIDRMNLGREQQATARLVSAANGVAPVSTFAGHAGSVNTVAANALK